MEIGKRVITDDLVDYFSANEGSINMIYGKIGNGKTYCATAMILDLLDQGKVVYCNWHIEVQDFDDRKSFLRILKNIILFRKRFFVIPESKNLHYFDPEQFSTTGDLVEWLSNLNDCEIFFDEGQDMFDSYEGTKFSKAKRRLILHTRHYHRTLNIISQRPTAIQVSARGNVNRFYKCVKLFAFPFLPPRFAVYEFQDMTGETVDEESEPVSVRRYWGKSRVFNAYNTDYLAEGIPKSQKVFFDAYDLTFTERFVALWFTIFKPRSQTPYVPLGIPSERCRPPEGAFALYRWSPDAFQKLAVHHVLPTDETDSLINRIV